jgi:sulfur-oxidizing protein SoxX
MTLAPGSCLWRRDLRPGEGRVHLRDNAERRAKVNVKRIIIRGGLRAAGVAMAALLVGACSDQKSGAGLKLPDGDIAAGRAAFVRLECTKCHTVAGEQFVGPVPASEVNLPLGGVVYRVGTYGQLITSIINPQHIVTANLAAKYRDPAGKSLMPDYTAIMTVDEMIDLVAFLQATYQLQEPPAAYLNM